MEPAAKVQEVLHRMQGKGKYCRNPHGDVLQFPDLPEGTKAVFYTHYIPDDLTINGKPAVTVALLFDPKEPTMIARGIAICSPQENSIKKEGRIRAVGRALRAWNKKDIGPLFVHPRAISVIREVYIPENNSSVFGGGFGVETHKYMWQPVPSRYEEKIIHNTIARIRLREETKDHG